jgi:predicted lipoprotein with Yx(FWY)xxD motif
MLPRPITRVVLVLTLTVTLGIAGFVAAGSFARSSAGTSATVSLHRTSLGMILVNAKGKSLYLFMKDRGGKSACSGGCATFWPPLISGLKPTAGTGVKASLLNTTMRGDGRRQVTYNGHPLYTYKLDTGAGQTKGEGNSNFGAKWWVVSARGTAVIKTAATTTTTTTPGTTTSCPYPPC